MIWGGVLDKKKVLITIIKRGHVKKMIRSIPKEISHGTMLLHGKGTVPQAMIESFVGLTYDTERDVMISLIDEKDVSAIQDLFMDIGKMHKKNTGVMFVVDVDQVFGALHRLDYL